MTSGHSNLSSKLPFIPIKLDLLNGRVFPGSHRQKRLLEIPEVEDITSTTADYQDPVVIAHMAAISINKRDANLVRGDDDMVSLRPGQAGDSELGALSLGGDDEAVAVIPEDGGVALGADVGSISS